MQDAPKTSQDNAEVTIRAFDPEQDTGFIVSTWPKAIYFGSIDEPGAPWDKWATVQHDKIKEMLTTHQVRVASLPESPLLIVGYVVLIDQKVEFIYVKKVYRKIGIGRLLCRGLGSFQPKNVTRAGLGFAKALGLKAAL